MVIKSLSNRYKVFINNRVSQRSASIDCHDSLDRRAAADIVSTGTRVVLILCLVLAVVVKMESKEQTLITTTLARATQLTDGLKPHAKRLVQDPQELKCLSQILSKESNWSPQARNGSHYGIGQMRSKWYGSLSGTDQITETVRYIKHRYKTMCLAWAFHERNNYY